MGNLSRSALRPRMSGNGRRPRLSLFPSLRRGCYLLRLRSGPARISADFGSSPSSTGAPSLSSGRNLLGARLHHVPHDVDELGRVGLGARNLLYSANFFLRRSRKPYELSRSWILPPNFWTMPTARRPCATQRFRGPRRPADSSACTTRSR